MADVLKSTQANQSPTKPVQVYSKLKQICRHLQHGHQEDAHEFLRYLMESMEKAYLLRFKNSKEFEQYTKETTPVNQIIGGYLRTSVKCLSCYSESVTFQHFEDLLLDIRKVTTIDEALKHHFARERLEGNDYSCDSCKRRVSATKQFSLERVPITLCIQLKRFSGMNGKIMKHINISPDLDLSQYLSRDMRHSQLKYKLVSMITHVGSSPHCGHYTAIGCCQNGAFYQFDDAMVREISINGLMNANPYIIFYELVPQKASITSTAITTTVTSSMIQNEKNIKRTESSDFIGPVLPDDYESDEPVLSRQNGCAIKQYGSKNNGSNGFGKKLITLSSNETITSKTSNSTTTNGSWPANSETSTSNVNTDSSSISESPKPIVESTNTSSNETTAKQLDDKCSSSDSESETPSSPKVDKLPNMPELKSNSPTMKNGDTTSPSNDIQSTDNGDSNEKRSSDNEKETATTNCSSVKVDSPTSSSPAKSISPISQRSEENRKVISIVESDSEHKVRSTSLPSVRQTVNPFSKDCSNSSKIVTYKKNGNGYHSSYNQHRSKLVNSYGVTPRKSLVPYPCHDDSDSNNEDGPMVRTKAGPFQVKNALLGNNNHRSSTEQRSIWSKSSNTGRVPSLNTWNGSSSVLQDEVSEFCFAFLIREIFPLFSTFESVVNNFSFRMRCTNA